MGRSSYSKSPPLDRTTTNTTTSTTTTTTTTANTTTYHHLVSGGGEVLGVMLTPLNVFIQKIQSNVLSTIYGSGAPRIGGERVGESP